MDGVEAPVRAELRVECGVPEALTEAAAREEVRECRLDVQIGVRGAPEVRVAVPGSVRYRVPLRSGVAIRPEPSGSSLMVLIRAWRIRRGSVGAGTGSDLGNCANSCRTRPVLDWTGLCGMGSVRAAVAAAGSSAWEGAARPPSARAALTATAAQCLRYVRRDAMRVLRAGVTSRERTIRGREGSVAPRHAPVLRRHRSGRHRAVQEQEIVHAAVAGVVLPGVLGKLPPILMPRGSVGEARCGAGVVASSQGSPGVT